MGKSVLGVFATVTDRHGRRQCGFCRDGNLPCCRKLCQIPGSFLYQCRNVKCERYRKVMNPHLFWMLCFAQLGLWILPWRIFESRARMRVYGDNLAHCFRDDAIDQINALESRDCGRSNDNRRSYNAIVDNECRFLINDRDGSHMVFSLALIGCGFNDFLTQPQQM